MDLKEAFYKQKEELNQLKRDYFAAIRTYLETCARNGVNEFTALLRLTQGQPYTISELIGEA